MYQPLISVIIPLYNCEKYIKDALDSIFKQNYPNIEVIVVNDGSTDHSLQIVEQFGKDITIIFQKNQGPASAKNTGIKQAKGSILAFLDSDDLWTDNHIQCMLPFLENDDSYDAVKGQTIKVKNFEDKSLQVGLPVSSYGNNLYQISEKAYYQPVMASGLYKADIFDKIGLFDETMFQGEDIDWVNRFNSSAGKEKKINETTLLYRRHENNMTNVIQDLRMGIFGAIRKKVHRERNPD